MTIQTIHDLFLKCTTVSIDTRKIEKGSFFVALRGERFDANTFAKEAIDLGASYVVIDNPAYFIDERTILVADSLQTLQALAQYHRDYLALPIVALTGSNGKTTTKELINVVLSKKYRVKATVGNLNNHIGVPLTLLSFTKDTQLGIVEMGANHQQEIAFLCAIAKPNYGYITNFGKAHLEGFGGVEGVIKGKSEMYAYLQAHAMVAFVNLDDAIQKEKTEEIERITFSQNSREANLFVDDVVANPFVQIKLRDFAIHSHLIGLYNANNINAALAIGNYFDVPLEDCKAAIESYVPENNRSQLVSKGTNEVILDAYNANPSSMRVALENFIQLGKPNKKVIIGDMYELGHESLAEHKMVVDYLAATVSFDCFFVGKDFFASQVAKPNFHFFNSFEAFAIELPNLQFTQATLLIKGSRGMALERVLAYL